MKQKGLLCPKCKGENFEIRLKKDEGVATAKCAVCATNYLILDSMDYWFDIIQTGYPRICRCACKCTVFNLRIDYYYRDNGDINEVELRSTCVSCQKTKLQFAADINYGGTEHLYDRPLVFCKNPKILYDLKEFNLFVTDEDLARIVDYLGHDRRCAFFCCCILTNNKWTRRVCTADQVKEIICNDRYLMFWASPHQMTLSDDEVGTAQNEGLFWKRNEVIRFSCPTTMILGANEGSLYYIKFSTQFLDGDQVKSKSMPFKNLTMDLVCWLQKEFVSWRGPNSFDNLNEHIRLFGNKFCANNGDKNY